MLEIVIKITKNTPPPQEEEEEEEILYYYLVEWQRLFTQLND